jgi:hypothetical protein
MPTTLSDGLISLVGTRVAEGPGIRHAHRHPRADGLRRFGIAAQPGRVEGIFA